MQKGIFAFIGLIIVALLFSCFHVVPAGNRGIKFSAISGLAEHSFGEGMHLKIPFVETFYDMSVRVEKQEYKASAASADLQTVSTTVALNFRPDPAKAWKLYQDVGTSYRSRVVDPSIQEAVKSVTAKYTAEELITKRDEVRENIQLELQLKMEKNDILVSAVNITDFSFSRSFDHAIEQKQTAEQMALKAKRDLERIKIEAEQRVTQATAEAEAQRLLARSITQQIVELKRIEAFQAAINKWNGHMPQVAGSALPFWDVLEGSKKKR